MVVIWNQEHMVRNEDKPKLMLFLDWNYDMLDNASLKDLIARRKSCCFVHCYFCIPLLNLDYIIHNQKILIIFILFFIEMSKVC